MYHIHNSATLYVSPTYGDDHGNGWAPMPDTYGNGPLKTLERALTHVRSLRATGANRPLSIALTEDYPLSAPLSLTGGVDGITLESSARKDAFSAAFV